MKRKIAKIGCTLAALSLLQVVAAFAASETPPAAAPAAETTAATAAATPAPAAPATVVTTQTVPATPVSPALTVTTTTPAAKALPDRFMLRMGGYHARDANTILRLDANNVALGTTIDFAKNLGGETETTVGRVDGLFRFNDAHALTASWYNLSFNGTRTLDRSYQWGDNVLDVNARLDSDIEFDIYKLSYQYSLFHNDQAELGASFGFHVMQTSVGFAGSINGVAGSSTTKSVTAPLPVWGLFASYDFTPKLKTYYTYQVFNINYDDKVKGGIQDFLLGLEYRVIPNVGLGVAYNRFAANLEVEGDATTLYFDTNWNGGMLYGSVYF